MQLQIIHRTSTTTTRPRLLLFFAGWGQSPASMGEIHVGGYDTALVWDYRDNILSEEAEAFLGRYGEIVVAAWSFGVHAAAHFLTSHRELPVTTRIAFSGSRHTVDETLGIPPALFHATLENLSERAVEKFEMRVWGGATAFRRAGSPLSGRSVEELREELHRFNTGAAPKLLWDRAYVPSTDLIIPPAAQLRAWADEAVVVTTIDSAHRPDFNRLLNHALTDKSHVASRFSRSRSTYDSHASLQHEAGLKLLGLAEGFITQRPESMIDIGCATGALSREVIERLRPLRAELWDLKICEEVKGLASTMSGLCSVVPREGDAEIAVRSLANGSVDLIFTASTAQWFNSLREFLHEAYRALSHGGVLALSTYGPSTMKEIAAVTGRPSRFLPLEAINRAVPREATILHLSEEINRLTFPSPLDALRHVSRTGVNALGGHDNSDGTRHALELLREYPLEADGTASLTFHPIYLIIKKP